MPLSMIEIGKMVVAGKIEGLGVDEMLERVEAAQTKREQSDREISAALVKALGSAVVSMSKAADGAGFFYGELQLADRVGSLNLLPPLPLWTGDSKLPSYPPHATDWIVYLDGEEVGRNSDIEALSIDNV